MRRRLAVVIALALATFALSAPTPVGASTRVITKAVPVAALDALVCPSGAVDSCLFVGSNDSVGAVVTANGAIESVPGTVELTSIACPTRASCLAVGYDADDSAVVVPVAANGLPGAAEEVPGADYLASIDCTPRPSSNCFAVGDVGLSDGAVVPVSPDGEPGSVVTVPDGQLNSIACANATQCVAVGRNLSAFEGFSLPIGPSSVGEPTLIPDTETLASISCWSGTACLAAGPETEFQGTTVQISADGTVGSTGTLSGPPTSITCGASGCAATTSVTGEGTDWYLQQVSHAGTGLGRVELVNDSSAAYVSDVSCPTKATCLAVGVNGGGVIWAVSTK